MYSIKSKRNQLVTKGHSKPVWVCPQLCSSPTQEQEVGRDWQKSLPERERERERKRGTLPLPPPPLPPLPSLHIIRPADLVSSVREALANSNASKAEKLLCGAFKQLKNARLKGDIVLNTALSTLAVENTELFNSPSAIEVCASPLSLSLSLSLWQASVVEHHLSVIFYSSILHSSV